MTTIRFDAYSPSEQLCPDEASSSDWNQRRRHLIEIHVSVVHGNILKSLRRCHQPSKWDADDFEIVHCDDGRPALSDRLVPIPDGAPSEIIESIKEVCSARVSHLRQVPQSVATICDIFGVATDAGLEIVDSGATETDHQRHFSLSCQRFRKSCLAQRWMQDAE